MHAKQKYWVYLLVLHIAIGVLGYLWIENKWYFIASQLPLLFSLYLGIRFFDLTDKPYRQLVQSIRDMEHQDLNTSIAPSGNALLDHLIQTYNRMIAEMREERYKLEGHGKFLTELIAVSPIGILIADYDGFVEEANLSAAQCLGLAPEKLRGTPLSTLLPTMEEGQDILALDNKRLRISSSIVRYKGFLRKVVMLEDLTGTFLKTEKEAYGKIIRMMAHEVNNSTGAVNSILQVLQDFFATEHPDTDWPQAVDIAIERNKTLSRFVENFASVLRVYPPQKQPVSLYDLAEKTVQLWSHEARKKNIELRLKHPEEDIRPIGIDPIQMEQVLSNAIKNALESIGSEGVITMEVGRRGAYLCIADNGAGLDAETADAIYQKPFFSTKPQGQGIGLMLTKEIMALHEGRFSLSTGEDGLTRFELFFE